METFLFRCIVMPVCPELVFRSLRLGWIAKQDVRTLVEERQRDAVQAHVLWYVRTCMDVRVRVYECVCVWRLNHLLEMRAGFF
jgi:hypothetical protein